jgi:predicted Fe-Mo cluster-binding NifX family protein
MEIAIPTDEKDVIYRDNAFTAPKFAIYSVVLDDKANISFHLKSIIENPLKTFKCDGFKDEQLTCNCKTEYSNNLHHVYEHYALLDAIGGCSYLLANHYCKNVIRSMKNGGITIYKIPPIIKKIDTAIINFLIGASFASPTQRIHYAS